MILFITGDYDVRSGLGQVTKDLYHSGYEKRFVSKDYGVGLAGVCIVLISQDPALQLKQRVRFVKAKRKLYMDLMLDLEEMKAATPEARRRIVSQKIAKEVPEIVSRYALPDFDAAGFLDEMKSWLDDLGWQ